MSRVNICGELGTQRARLAGADEVSSGGSSELKRSA
jgi:hypothetical protein